MAAIDDEFLKQLLATFRVEAQDHLQTLVTGLLELEKDPPEAVRAKVVETVFRAAHSLKGSARAVDLASVESRCQSLEDTFAAWKRQDKNPPPADFDALHRSLEAIRSDLDLAAGSRPMPGPVDPPPQERPPARAPQPPPATESFAPAETVRIAVAKLDSRLLESEELLAAKFSAAQRVADLRELANLVAEGRTRWTEVDLEIRSLCASRGKAPAQEASRPVPGLTRLLDYCAWSLDRSRLLAARMADAIQLAERDRQTTGKLVDDLLEASKKLIMLPFGTISTSFPKLVRDLCRSQGKEASFSIQGVGIEIDKRTLEEIKDALVHLLRNAVDHGIEDPAARARAGKARRGTIRLEVTQGEGNKVQVAVADDGAGIDSGQVKAAAIRRKLVSAEEAARFDEAEALELIFLSEMSTSAVITKVSGRGLGLAIVRERARKLDGEVTVESLQGQGTTFRIVLPAVRSTVRGILFTAAGGTWMVPTPQVDRVLRVHPGDLLVIQGQATLAVAGFRVPLVHLADALGLPAAKRNVMPSTGQQVLVLGTGDRRFAFIVDSILNEQEMLVKALPKPLVRVPNVAAATVLGTGQIVPVLNVSDLLKSAGRSKPPDPNGVAEESPAPGAPRSILVVEDSITSRMLLKGILEAAGYRIKTAADGIEAFTLLRTEPFDLVVSDVEMPRMDGFGLTAKIRSDPGLAQLPVVLVTALETREDRERGVDAGADAYLVKSSFDQSALLETVRRLV